uniref:Uncharacterized protein n=1 Tax=candidate division WOR-3 bacterium TaxID=2052148 RepID=A0A7C3UNP7_UNCW3
MKLLILSFISSCLEWENIYPSAPRSSTMIIGSLNQKIILFGGNDVWEMLLDNLEDMPDFPSPCLSVRFKGWQ